LRPIVSEAHTFTVSPTLYEEASEVKTSTIFSLLSDEEQIAFA
jgi:hypothetical protein